uniref:Spermatogenesis-associated protein 4 n=1 Tax=Haptolina brevifila TaxID=156173 RepID=A0A7S2NCQ1_9EUKA|eukprot:CAMPEP_0174728840 /NCGR_PEP_ID=MMETSP1094-20130205/52523_1 /TAXON_ID=156173 /ORGANISM="Chrysochromulina brevifilum, Strain UTEX LB 985" /LENGTH=780 /DNA_ID=CAMNT_0015930839 /DNA_START=56 /DNA_END=2398 /DNA_ORIENTATION=+
MSGLPRELLKWLQSLDLTYSVKNVKRDFSNGFLVAEIFSRYYVQDVEMHSYENGMSLKIKLDNWGQLKRFFNNRGIQIPENLIEDVVHAKSQEAAADLISVVYTLLTGRTINAPKYTSHDPAIDRDDPAYTRPNASSLLASNIRESEMSTTLQDQTTAASRAKSVIDEHGDMLRSMRETEPSRYALPPGGTSSAVSMQRMLRGPAKPVPPEIEAAQVRFQEVRVTAVDRNIAQLRASRDPALGGGNSYVSSVAAPTSMHSGAGVAHASQQPPRTAGTVDVVALLTEATLQHCPEVLLYVQQSTQPSPRAFGLLVDELALLPLTEVQTLFAAAKANAVAPLVHACKAEPSNAWQVFALLTPALITIDASLAFDSVCDFLIAFGKGLASEGVGSAVLTKYALPHLLPLLKSLAPLKAPKLLLTVYGLVPETAASHIDAIRALQEVLDDQSAFVNLLPHLVALEPSFNDDLFNLFIYYGVMALDLDSSQLRSSAIGVLAVLADARHGLILELLPKLDSISDSWWEVQAQLGRLGATLLRHVDARLQSAGPISLLTKSLKSRCPGTQIIALAAAAPLLASYPVLLPTFIDSLLSLPAPQRRLMLLEAGEAVPVTTANGTAKEASPLPPMWQPLQVASALMDQARAYNLDTLEPQYADVLTALESQVGASSSAGEWGAWLKTNKDYLYVALCDEELCVPMASFLLALFTRVTEEALPTFSTLLSSLRMLCDSCEPGGLCHRTAITLLSTLLDQGAPFRQAITNLITNFDAPMRASLAELVAKVEG